MVGVGNALMFAAVKQMVEANAKISKTAIIAVTAVASMAADPAAMTDAAGMWKQIANNLNTLSSHLGDALGKGEDKNAFESSFVNFKGEIEQLKTAIGDIASVLDAVSNAYFVSYTALFFFAGSCLVILIGLVVLLFIPHTSAAARVVIEQIGSALAFFSAKTAVLLSGLAAAAAAMIGTVLFHSSKTDSTRGLIPAPVEFEKIRIDYTAPKEFKVKGD